MDLIYTKLVKMNEAGFSGGQILAYFMLYMALRHDLRKHFKVEFDSLVKAVNSLVEEIKVIKTHINLKEK